MAIYHPLFSYGCPSPFKPNLLFQSSYLQHGDDRGVYEYIMQSCPYQHNIYLCIYLGMRLGCTEEREVWKACSRSCKLSCNHNHIYTLSTQYMNNKCTETH
ncbi:hypothetical protein EON63_19880 [archaeon]|nr:MAG: hypothetical protein EON63_19880 [archaeon]